MKYVIVYMFLLFCSLSLFPQTIIRGHIKDSLSYDPLAFVHIIYNNDSTTGTLSDINGYFTIKTNKKIHVLGFSYIGYHAYRLDIDNINTDLQSLEIDLKPKQFKLNEVVIFPGINPAHRIINNAVKKRHENDPENISSFSYETYNKMIVEYLLDYQVIDSINKNSDDTVLIKTIKRFVKQSKKNKNFITESVTKRKFLYPDKDEESVIATRVSGYKRPSFATLPTLFQPFTFYKTNIPLADKIYVNPISNNSTNKYFFNIEDTLYYPPDTVFVISFRPRRHKTFNALKGVIYINTNNFAIQNIIAEPDDLGTVNIKVQQMYEFVDEKQWFPVQLNYEVTIPHFPKKYCGYKISGNSFIRNISLFPDLDKKEFGIDNLIINENAFKKDTLFWIQKREHPLTAVEEYTYHLIDSLGEEHNLDGILDAVENIAFGKIRIKYIDLDLNSIVKYNVYEKTRLGIGLYTNNRLSPYFSIGGHIGYGFNDKAWKYGSGLTLYFNKEHEVDLTAEYNIDVINAAHSSVLLSDYDFSATNYMNQHMDIIEEKRASLGFRGLRYAKVYLFLSQDSKEATYDYAYLPKLSSGDSTGIFNFTNAGFTIKYAYREKFFQCMNQRFSEGTKYPILFFFYTRGLKDILDGEYEYNKYECRVYDNFHYKNLGTTEIRVEAGYVQGDIPFCNLFAGKAGYDKNIVLVVKNTFQTMRFNEFLSDKYINFFFTHDFGSLIFKSKKFKPEVKLIQNIAYGILEKGKDHLLDYKTLDNGFFESGLYFNNLLKLNYMHLADIGFGVGAFYRYGYYALENEMDNLAIKLSLTLNLN